MFDQVGLLADASLAMWAALEVQINTMPVTAAFAVWLALGLLGVITIQASWFTLFRDPTRARHGLLALVVASALHGSVLLCLPALPLKSPSASVSQVEIALVTLAAAPAETATELSSPAPPTSPAAKSEPSTQASVALKPKPVIVANKKNPAQLKPTPVPLPTKPKPAKPKPPLKQAKVRSTTTATPTVSQQARSGVATSAAASTQRQADYFAQLSAWLNKHKRYPRRARQRGQQGTAHLRFVINRQGQVLSANIARSSGYRALDDEAENMLQRAIPLPPIPTAIAQTKLELVLPVSFQLR